MDPSELFLPLNTPVLLPNGFMNPVWWNYFVNAAQTLGTVDLTTQVTGVLPFVNGGTSHSNLQFTTTGATNVTLPLSGTLLTKDSSVTAKNLNVTDGVVADSGGIKHARVTTGLIGAGLSAVVTVTWGTAFGDTAYTTVASVLDATAAVASLQVIHIESQTAAAVTVRVLNSSAGGLTGTLDVVALHD